MSTIKTRRTVLLDKAVTAVGGSTLPDRTQITVTTDGADYERAVSPAAGGIVIYPMPAVEYPAPRVQRLTWTLAVVCDLDDTEKRMDRLEALLDLLYTAGVVRWSDRATPTDFEASDKSRKYTGYTITHIEEHKK